MRFDIAFLGSMLAVVYLWFFVVLARVVAVL